jgi:hypothetical protein
LLSAAASRRLPDPTVTVLFLFAAAVLSATALIFAACLRPRSAVSLVLAAYLLGITEIVVLTEVLSPFGWIGPLGYALGEALLLAAALVCAWRFGAPVRIPRVSLRESSRAHPLVAALAGVAGLAFLYEAFIGLSTPPNDWDSMVYHLPRAATWLQQGSISYIADAPTQQLNIFPPNWDFQLLYTMALSGSDTFATLPQLAALLALLLAVYGIARRLGADRAPALFASLLTGTLSAVALQAVYTKNDLAVASLLVCAVYFLLVSERHSTWWAGLAVGLALGTKLTAFYGLAPLLVIALATQRSRRQLATFGLACALSFGVVGSVGYALNIADSGKPLGNHNHTPPPPVEQTVPGTISTSARILYDFIDLSGYRLPDSLLGAGRDLGRTVFDVLRIPKNPPESTARPFAFEPNTRADIYNNTYFGPLGVLLVLPVTVWILVAWARRRTDRVHGALALALPLFILAVALSYPYNQSIGRFLIAPAALSLALAAPFYRFRWVATATAGIAVVSLFCVHVNDINKPVGLFGRPAIWSLPRAAAQAVHDKTQRALIESVDAGSQTGPLGAVLKRADRSYPLFGDSLDRKVVYLPKEDALQRAAELGIPRVVLRQELAAGLNTSGWTVTALKGPWALANRKAS